MNKWSSASRVSNMFETAVVNLVALDVAKGVVLRVLRVLGEVHSTTESNGHIFVAVGYVHGTAANEVSGCIGVISILAVKSVLWLGLKMSLVSLFFFVFVRSSNSGCFWVLVLSVRSIYVDVVCRVNIEETDSTMLFVYVECSPNR